MNAEEADVGDADEGPPLVWPEHDDGPPLRGLGSHVEVGEANAPQIRGQTDQDVPGTVKIGEVDRGPHLTEDPVAEPAKQRQGPPEP